SPTPTRLGVEGHRTFSRLAWRGAQRRGEPSVDLPTLGLPQSATLLRNDKRVLYGRSAATWRSIPDCHRESSTKAEAACVEGAMNSSPRLSARGAKRRGDPSDPCPPLDCRSR